MAVVRVVLACPRSDGSPRPTNPFAVFGRRCCTQARHARTKPILHSRCDDSTVGGPLLLTRCQSHLSSLSAHCPAPVSSPHRGRHVNSLSVLECFLGAVLAVLQNCPARTPLRPPPCRCLLPFPSTGKSHPRRSIFLFRAPPSLPTRHFLLRLPSSHPSQSQLSSSSAQLESGTHTLSLSHTRTHTSVACSCCGRRGTARQDRHDLFIVLVAWVSCVHSTVVHAHAQTYTHKKNHLSF